MSYDPPIRSRDTKDLLSIVENGDDWKEDALKTAREELVQRGYPIQQQKRRRKSRRRYQQRVNTVKANASFSARTMALIFVFAPYLLAASLPSELPLIGCGETTWELKSEGYAKKWKQRLLMMTLGNLTWLLILIVLY